MARGCAFDDPPRVFAAKSRHVMSRQFPAGRCWMANVRILRIFVRLAPTRPAAFVKFVHLKRGRSAPCDGFPGAPPFVPAFRIFCVGRSITAERLNAASTAPCAVSCGALVQFGLIWDVDCMPSGVAIPSANLDFAWDRPETADSLRERLLKSSRSEWLRLAAWILREARVEEVWQFLTLWEVADAFPHLCGRLGPRRPVWEHLLRAAHELGRL